MSETKQKTKAKPRAKAKVKAPVVVKYVSVKNVLWHPFQKVRIPMGTPGVMLEEDSWLKSQITAGLIAKV